MKYLKYLLVSLVGLLLISGCQNCSHQPQKVEQPEIGKVYQSGGEFKLIDEHRFVGLNVEARFESEEQLKELRVDNEDFSIYPTIYFTEGTYEKNGDTYRLTTERSVRVEFKNVGNIQKKIVSRKTLEENSNPQGKYFTLEKKTGTYTVNGKEPVLTSDREIPDSIEDFLAQYKYEPEELE